MAEQPSDEEELVFSDQVEMVPSRLGTPPEEGLHAHHIDPALGAAAPNLAVAGLLGQANANGSPKARRQARIIAWTMIVILVLVVAATLLA